MNTKDGHSREQPVKPEVRPDRGGIERQVVPVRVPENNTVPVKKHEVLPKDIRRGK